MSVVLVVVIVTAWMIVLGPNLLKRRSHAGGIHSISRFHRSLRTLARSGPPPIVPPAYRLRAVGRPDGTERESRYPEVSAVPVMAVVGATALPRPALAFLGEALPEQPGPDGDRPLPDLTSDPRTLEWSSDDRSVQPADGPARHLVRKRRRDTLGVLVATFVATVLVGLVPGASVALALSTVPGVALVAYVLLLIHLRQEAEERERKLHYLDPHLARSMTRAPSASLGSGSARVPVYMSGRYAHPSNQALLAR